ncbi:hypothetical protein SBBP1_1330003 [Burkholderiales bacterium]|nr:hypothetical protein SBBP1_1330003 [Burkholderiales bacterium]
MRRTNSAHSNSYFRTHLGMTLTRICKRVSFSSYWGHSGRDRIWNG